MSEKYAGISVQQICDVIDMLYPCMDDYVYVYDLENDYYYISPSATERFALPGAKFNNVVENHTLFVYPDDLGELQKDLDEIAGGRKDFHNLQYRWLSRDRKPIWVNCRGTVIKENDRVHYMIGCINEIGTRQKADNISGLLGLSSLKAYFEENFYMMNSGYILRLGIDDFKAINEKLGIEYGDMLLRKTADCISSCLYPDQNLYRAMADEFLILDFGARSVEEALEQYVNVRYAIDRFVEDSHYEAVFTISGGILSSDAYKNCTFNDVMKFSEFALSEAKRDGKNRCWIFNYPAYEKFLKNRRLIQLLRKAVNNDFEGFEAYLQPLFDTKTGKLYGAESLMRFHTEEFGTVPPGVFIPLLEETCLIIPVGKWMLHKSLELCTKIHKTNPDFKISINISYIQVLKSNIISEILSAVSDYNIIPSTVIIELTESGILTPDSRVSKLRSRMKEQDISLALDDFGTGYSNFHYFNDLKPDIIKIDRSFTVKAIENNYEFNLLQLMINMAHSMDLRVCVEGVETLSELERIKQLNPDYCQGYYFGRPCPFDEFMKLFVNEQ